MSEKIARVQFKPEGQNADGEDVGPLTLITERELGQGPTTRPYEPECVCDVPDPERLDPNGARCRNCGRLHRLWYPRSQAEAIAGEHGVALEG